MARTTEARTNGKRGNDLAGEDVGNIVSLEHVNVTIPDQPTAMVFYILGMGFTRDPYMNVGLDNMWINLGEQQFHLPTRGPQVIPGVIGIVVPNLEALEGRLMSVRERLAGTQFGYTIEADHVDVTCPWGNHLRCYAPHPRFGDMVVGMPYVEFKVRPGTAAGIARFYKKVMLAPASVEQGTDGTAVRVSIGTHQQLVFRETDEPIPAYDGHHIAVYVANFSKPYQYMRSRDQVTEDVMNHQFRLLNLIDPDNGEQVFTLEHEVRGLHHAMYHRDLVNRNSAQVQRSYVRGHDALIPMGS